MGSQGNLSVYILELTWSTDTEYVYRLVRIALLSVEICILYVYLPILRIIGTR